MDSRVRVAHRCTCFTGSLYRLRAIPAVEIGPSCLGSKPTLPLSRGSSNF